MNRAIKNPKMIFELKSSRKPPEVSVFFDLRLRASMFETYTKKISIGGIGHYSGPPLGLPCQPLGAHLTS
jgi:hypothetical protein